MSEVEGSWKENMKQAIRKALLLSFAGVLATACQSTWSTAAAQSSSSSAASTRITITPTSSQKVIAGAPDRFTGSVRVQSLFDAKEPARSSGGQVTFQAGARSAWHTHPLGQVLIVTEGVGWIQQWGGPVQVIRKGDVVWIPAGVKHWHGATPTSAMTHIAFQEQLD
jgi:quercetin dioxygenase-like cupin family protein